MSETSQVTVTVSGPVGCGKSAVYFEIVAALQSVGLTVSHDDPAEWLMESGMREHIGPPETDIKVHMIEKVEA